MIRLPIRAGMLMVPLLLGGCVVAWGDAYHIAAQTPDAITVQYDTNFIDEPEVAKLARAHCNKSGRIAIAQTHEKSMWGLSTERFLCQNPPATHP